MIKIVAKQTVKQDKINNFIAIAKKLVEETLRLDTGCISYGLFQDSEDSGILTFIEEWENPEALDKHMASGHFTEFFPQLGEFLEKPAEVNRYQMVE